MLISGGVTVIATQGKRLCCHPAKQISSAIRVFFRISAIGSVNQLLGSLLFPPLLLPPLSSPTLRFSTPPSPLKVGP